MGKLIYRGFQKSPPDWMKGPSIIYGENLRTSTKPKSPAPKAAPEREPEAPPAKGSGPKGKAARRRPG